MKKSDFFKGFICLVIVFIAFLFCGKVERTYSVEAKVYSVENNVITFEDKIGQLWEYEEEEGTYKEGQKVKLTIDDNYSKEFEDDKIIKIKKVK